MDASSSYFLYEKKLYEKWGGFDLKYKICSDYDSVIRFLKMDGINVAYLPSVFIKMRVGGASNNSLGNFHKKLKEDICILKENNIFWPTAIVLKRVSKVTQFILNGF